MIKCIGKIKLIIVIKITGIVISKSLLKTQFHLDYTGDASIFMYTKEMRFESALEDHTYSHPIKFL